MERLRERLDIAEKALLTLIEILQEPRTSIVRDAAIQRFEYTFEAVWKAAQLYLRTVEGTNAGSPKAAIRFSREVGLLASEETRSALVMADDRNLTVHTYNETLADRIYASLNEYALVMKSWVASMRRNLQ